MPDKYDAFIVVLEHNIPEGDAEATINAIQQIKGVLEVKHHTADVATMIAQVRARQALTSKILKALKEE